jgi:phosphate transport system permease protein
VGEFVASLLARGGAVAVAFQFLLLAGVLARGAGPAIARHGLRFFYSTDWDPVNLHFGALPMLLGTLITSLLALLLAVPVSVGAALCLERLCPRWISIPAGFLIELLAAIPSITYGLWGVTVLLPFAQRTGFPFLQGTVGRIPWIGELFSGPVYGFSVLGSSLVLAIMILPIVTLVTRDVLRVAPRDVEEGAYALGATWWQAVRLLLSSTKLGILGAVTLGFSRAVGETMAVTMLIGNRNAIDRSLFAPGQTMSSLLANEFLEADKREYVEALIYVAVVLFLFTMLTNMIARWLVSMAGTPRNVPGETSPETEGPLPALPNGLLPRQGKILHPILPRGKPRPAFRFRLRAENRAAQALSVLSCVGSVATLGFILGYVLYRGFSALSLDFFTRLPGPAGSPSGMRNCIVGTGIMVAIGCAGGIPLGLLSGIFLAEYKATRFQKAFRLVVDVLAGTPSIIIGVMVYEVLVKSMGHPSGWAGGAALGFLMSPIVARVTEDMLRLVPAELREASLALGARRYETLLRVVLPVAKGGILTGILLAIARIAGETAPLIFTALGSDSDVLDPDKPMPSLTLKIYQYATSAEPDWIRQSWAGMLVLVFSVLFFSIAVRWTTADRSRRAWQSHGE